MTVIRMSPIDAVAALIADLDLSPAQAHELRLAMVRHSKEYSITHEQLRRVPACRRIWDALLLACAGSVNTAQVVTVREELRGVVIDAD